MRPGEPSVNSLQRGVLLGGELHLSDVAGFGGRLKGRFGACWLSLCQFLSVKLSDGHCAEKLLAAKREAEVDYAQTAALGTAAFENPSIVLSGDHLKWFYEKSFSRGATVIRLEEDGRKVGQIAMVNQLVVIDGKEEDASQLVDLFIEKSHRGKRALTMLYAEVEKQFNAQKIRFAFGHAECQGRARQRAFLSAETLSVAAGAHGSVASAVTAPKAKTSFRFAPELRKGVVALGDRFATPNRRERPEMGR